MVSKVRQKLNSIESIQKRCYEEFNQCGIELSRESTFDDFRAHVAVSELDQQGLSISHSYDKYYFYTMFNEKETQIILYVEWKQSENFDPKLCEWRIFDHYSKKHIPKIKTFKDLIKVLKDC